MRKAIFFILITLILITGCNVKKYKDDGLYAEIRTNEGDDSSKT